MTPLIIAIGCYLAVGAVVLCRVRGRYRWGLWVDALGQSAGALVVLVLLWPLGLLFLKPGPEDRGDGPVTGPADRDSA